MIRLLIQLTKRKRVTDPFETYTVNMNFAGTEIIRIICIVNNTRLYVYSNDSGYTAAIAMRLLIGASSLTTAISRISAIV